MINQAPPQVTIERTLAQLRWRPADFDEATLLRRIAEYPAYWLLLHDGEPFAGPGRPRSTALLPCSLPKVRVTPVSPNLAPHRQAPKSNAATGENCSRDCDNATMTVSSSTAWDQTVRLPLPRAVDPTATIRRCAA